jgi:hypothetical protein
MPATRRAALLAGLALALVAALIITTLAGLAAIRRSPFHLAAHATATGGAQMTTTPGASPFVCANAPDAHSAYVFVNDDTQLYRVSGCADPVKLTSHDAETAVTPLGFSPSNRWLMVATGPAKVAEGAPSVFCQALLNPQTGALKPTTFCEDTSLGPSPSAKMMRFVGWLDDAAFVEAEFTKPTTFSGPVRILRVSATTLTPTLVTALTWVANLATGDSVGIKIRGGSLFYGGYKSIAEGGAWLHRVSLADGADTRLVKLGVVGTGGCQVYEGPCAWTGPWDVSPDGTHLAYHNPGPTQSLSDTSNEPGTPLYYAKIDGTSASQLFGGASDQGFTTALFSPTGAAILSNSRNGPQGNAVETLATQRVTGLPEGYFAVRWRGDGVALLLNDVHDNTASHAALFDIATGKTTQLPGVADSYVWGA